MKTAREVIKMLAYMLNDSDNKIKIVCLLDFDDMTLPEAIICLVDMKIDALFYTSTDLNNTNDVIYIWQ